jgi:nucleotide-binding universal stress UspA family protein
MIGKHDSAIKVRRILVAVDGSQHSERALDYGIYMAKGLEAELLIVNAVDWGRYPGTYARARQAEAAACRQLYKRRDK